MLPDPAAAENVLKQSGRGIFLIRAFMDESIFRTVSPGIEITMTKSVRGPDRDRKQRRFTSDNESQLAPGRRRNHC